MLKVSVLHDGQLEQFGIKVEINSPPIQGYIRIRFKFENQIKYLATEPPFQNEYYQHKENGLYNCIVCGETIFQSDSKFDSGCGWPAFSAAQEGKTESTIDKSHGMTREEIHCMKCKAHLGHLFNDGPRQGGLRYCINSASMKFKQEGNK